MRKHLSSALEVRKWMTTTGTKYCKKAVWVLETGNRKKEKRIKRRHQKQSHNNLTTQTLGTTPTDPTELSPVLTLASVGKFLKFISKYINPCPTKKEAEVNTWMFLHFKYSYSRMSS